MKIATATGAVSSRLKVASGVIRAANWMANWRFRADGIGVKYLTILVLRAPFCFCKSVRCARRDGIRRAGFGLLAFIFNSFEMRVYIFVIADAGSDIID
jgi:hypothetical protein